jgi:hypothetical protein
MARGRNNLLYGDLTPLKRSEPVYDEGDNYFADAAYIFGRLEAGSKGLPQEISELSEVLSVEAAQVTGLKKEDDKPKELVKRMCEEIEALSQVRFDCSYQGLDAYERGLVIEAAYINNFSQINRRD